MENFKYYILFDDGTVRGTNQLVEMEGSKNFFELKNTGQKTYLTMYKKSYDVFKLIPVDISGENIEITISEIYSLKYFITSQMKYNAYNTVVDACLLNLSTGKDLILPSLFEIKTDISDLSLVDKYDAWDLTIDMLITSKSSDITKGLNEKIKCLQENLTTDLDALLDKLRAAFWFNAAKRLRELVKDIVIESASDSDVAE
ncbi:MAG: hypothetical protein RLZZ71_2123 [Bacteroidota bacterium]|jgi:hypothetical protein